MSTEPTLTPIAEPASNGSNKKDAQRFSNLLDLCFALPAGQHYSEDFPVWFSDSLEKSPIQRLGFFSEDRLVAGAAVRLAEIRTLNGATLPIGIIGAVATDPAFRGKGLASRLVETAVSWAEKQGAALTVLWGSELRFYQRMGFDLFGLQCRIPLNEISLPGCVKPPPVHQGWVPAIFDLVRQRSSGVILKPGDLTWYGAHKNVEWHYTGPIDAPTAYVAVGRGIDLINCIHEWGGKLDHLKYLLSTLRPDLSLLGHPKILEKVFGFRPPVGCCEFLCLAKSLKPVPADLEPNLWIWGLDAA